MMYKRTVEDNSPGAETPDTIIVLDEVGKAQMYHK